VVSPCGDSGDVSMPAGADGDLVSTAALFLIQRYACVLPKNVCPGAVAVGELSVDPIFRF
jgi:hypothetical protein